MLGLGLMKFAFAFNVTVELVMLNVLMESVFVPTTKLPALNPTALIAIEGAAVEISKAPPRTSTPELLATEPAPVRMSEPLFTSVLPV
jgi:hypothetical protein